MDIRPVVLLTANFDVQNDIYTLNHKYCRIIEKCGAVPVIVPYTDTKNMEYLLKKASAVLLTGGGDVSPQIAGIDQAVFSRNCNGRRDSFEIKLCRYCYGKGISVMGICRGMQVMCVAAGGSIYEDISLFSKTANSHIQTIDKKLPSHKVYVKRKSILHRVVKKDSIYVNSLHHQCIRDCGFLTVSAKSKDGLVEAVEGNKKALYMGFQWHPEQCFYGGYSEKIFKFFIDNCR
ncbi:MAG: gamma-glutamyl-gamma-aminobutyrate hydrolase family protein [Firmicutes bacterium]|nr:gamma-glutamyl-gamma-aminobutyrate hydrolase family protein [Bacillota bacterium]